MNFLIRTSLSSLTSLYGRSVIFVNRAFDTSFLISCFHSIRKSKVSPRHHPEPWSTRNPKFSVNYSNRNVNQHEWTAKYISNCVCARTTVMIALIIYSTVLSSSTYIMLSLYPFGLIAC